MEIAIPYGRHYLAAHVADHRLQAVLRSRLEEYVPALSQRALVEAALTDPIGSPALETLVRGKKKVVLIASDHTRPVPSKVLVPPMLAAIRQGNPEAQITILIATGCHRGTTKGAFTTSTFSITTSSRGRSRKSVTTAPIKRTTFIPSTTLPKIAW